MSSLNIQLTPRQQEILLRGLRYVRSASALDSQDWSEEVENQRQACYAEVAEIEAILNGETSIETANV